MPPPNTNPLAGNTTIPGQAAYEQLQSQQDYDLMRYAAQNNQQTKQILDLMLKMIRPNDPHGDQNLTATLAQVVGQMSARGVFGGSTTNQMEGVRRIFANSGVRGTIDNGDGTVVNSQFFGNGALTNQLSKNFFDKMEQTFFKGGAQNFSKTWGANRTELGGIADALQQRGAMAGMNAWTGVRGADGTIKTALDEGAQRKITDMMSETAHTLSFMRNIFGSKPAQEMISMAEQLAGMSISSAQGAKAVRTRLQQSVNSANAWGGSARDWLNKENQTAMAVDQATGNQGLGASASHDIEARVATAKQMHQEYAAANPGVFVPAFDEAAYRAQEVANMGGQAMDAKNLGNPLATTAYVLTAHAGRMSSSDRKALMQARQDYANADNEEAQQAAVTQMDALTVKITGDSMASFQDIDLAANTSREMQDQTAKLMRQAQDSQTTRPFLDAMSRQFQKVLGLGDGTDSAENRQATTDATLNYLQGLEGGQREKLIKGLNEGKGAATIDALGADSVTTAGLHRLLSNTSLTEKELAAGLTTAQSLVMANPKMAPLLVAEGSAEARKVEGQNIDKQLQAMTPGASDGPQVDMMAKFLQGVMGGSAPVDNATIAAAAAAEGKSAFTLGVDRDKQKFTGSADDTRTQIENLKKIGLDFGKEYGTNDTEELIGLLSADGGVGGVMKMLDAAGLSKGMVGGNMVVASDEERDSLVERQQRVNEARSKSELMTGKTFNDTDAEKLKAIASSTDDLGDSRKKTLEWLSANADEVAINVLSGKGKGKTQARALASMMDTPELKAQVLQSLKSGEQSLRSKGHEEQADKVRELSEKLEGSKSGKQFLGILGVEAGGGITIAVHGANGEAFE